MLRVHENREHAGTPYTKPATRQKFSEVAAQTSTGEACCPKCGGTSFVAKRSKKAKVLGAPMAILIPLAPKSQVKCMTCGEMFWRK